MANASLLGNLGNAYALAGSVPHAVLAYRLALRLSPADRGRANAWPSRSANRGAADGVGRPPDDPWPRSTPGGVRPARGVRHGWAA
ncbi:MAG: tetratricopeptide repeat protein [Gemmataceae bacterium]